MIPFDCTSVKQDQSQPANVGPKQRNWRGAMVVASVTRLGDLLDFGQLFKAFGNNLICPNLPHS